MPLGGGTGLDLERIDPDLYPRKFCQNNKLDTQDDSNKYFVINLTTE